MLSQDWNQDRVFGDLFWEIKRPFDKTTGCSWPTNKSVEDTVYGKKRADSYHRQMLQTSVTEAADSIRCTSTRQAHITGGASATDTDTGLLSPCHRSAVTEFYYRLLPQRSITESNKNP